MMAYLVLTVFMFAAALTGFSLGYYRSKQFAEFIIREHVDGDQMKAIIGDLWGTPKERVK